MELMDDICSNFRRRMSQGAKGGWHTQPYEEFRESFGRKEKPHVYGEKRQEEA